jgi:type II secretory pathway pseudopilin PulG
MSNPNSAAAIRRMTPQLPARARRKQAAFTLLELLLAILLGAAVMTVAIGLLARVIGASSAAADHLRGVVTLNRLGQQFRDDVHAASQAAVETAQRRAVRLVLTRGSDRIVYEVDPSDLLRREETAGRDARHEVYVLPGMKVLDFSAAAAGGPVSITIGRTAPRPDGGTVISGQFELTAVPGTPAGRRQP